MPDPDVPEAPDQAVPPSALALSERRSVQRGEIVSRVPAEWLLPYVHQRYDDLSPVGTED